MTTLDAPALVAEYTLDHLDKWLRPVRVRVPMATQPAHAWIQRDPLIEVLSHAKSVLRRLL